LLAFPSASYTDLLRVNNQLVAIAGNRIQNEPGHDRPEYALEGDLNLQTLSFPDDENCHNKTEYGNFQPLPDGRVGMIKDCLGGSGSPSNPLGDYRYLLAFDLDNQEITQIVDGPLSDRRTAGGYAWNPEMTLGVQEKGVGATRATLYWISPDGITEMDIEIEDDSLIWNLKDDFVNLERICSGMADRPAWSPDGNTISFFASSEPIQKDCQTHLIYRESLYFMDPKALLPTKILEGIYDPITPEWSPNSEALAFLGCYDSRVQCGIWVYFRSDGKLTKIVSGEFIGIAWTSDSSIAALKCNKQDEICYGSPTEVWEYSLDSSLK